MTSASPQQPTGPAASAPLGAPPSRPVVVLIGLVLVSLAVVAVWELLALGGFVAGTGPASVVVTGAQHWRWHVGYTVAGGAAILLGLVTIYRALSPRRRRHLQLRADSSAWILPRDLGRLVSARAVSTRGVLRAHALVTRKRIIVRALAGGRDRAAIITGIEEALAPVLALLAEPPALTVYVTTSQEDA